MERWILHLVNNLSEGQCVESESHAEAIGDDPTGRDGSEGGGSTGVVAEIVKQIGAVADVRSGEGQCIEIESHAEAIGDGPTGRDGSEGGESTGVLAEIVKQIGAVADVRSGEG